MAHRSPNCPHMTFQEAAEKGRKVFAKEKQHPTPKEIVAQDLGYSGLNGRSLSMLGALRQYGLIEGSGGALRVSDDAVAYFVRDDGAEKSEALKRMVYRPALFGELHDQFGDSLPSDGNLRHILIQKGFSEEAANDVIRVYKTNSDLILDNKPEYTESIEATRSEVAGVQTIPIKEPIQRVAGAPNAWYWTLSVPRGVNARLTVDGPFTKADFSRLKKQIEFLEESFDEEVTQ